MAKAQVKTQMTMNRRANVNKAKNRAAQAGPAIFSGQDALNEVAKDDGLWNWVLIGPDPEVLPLSGGGKGSVDQMRQCIGKHAHSFGLLRMTFGVGADAKIKFMFIHASDPIDSGNYSAVERGQAMGMEPVMDKAIRNYCHFAAKVHVQSPEECTVEHLVSELAKVVRGVDASIITVENFNAAVEHHKELNPDIVKEEKKTEEKAKHIEQMMAPAAELIVPEADLVPMESTSMTTEATRQRKRVRLYVKGDVVDVYSMKHQQWFEDAEIAEVVTESKVVDGYRVRAGSMKVIYDNGARFKWIAPQQMEDFLRPSRRPKAPEPVVGELFKETSSWFGAKYLKQYFELNKGFLQWWVKQDDARRGGLPEGQIYLLGLQQQENGAAFRLRTDSTQGAVFGFKADTEDEAGTWTEVLWAHAWFCEEMREFHEAKDGAKDVRKELLAVMQAKSKK